MPLSATFWFLDLTCQNSTSSQVIGPCHLFALRISLTLGFVSVMLQSMHRPKPAPGHGKQSL